MVILHLQCFKLVRELSYYFCIELCTLFVVPFSGFALRLLCLHLLVEILLSRVYVILVTDEAMAFQIADQKRASELLVLEVWRGGESSGP